MHFPNLPKPPTIFEQMQKWIEQMLPKKTETPKKAEPAKPRLNDMQHFDLLLYVKENYNLDDGQFYTAVADTQNYMYYGINYENLVGIIRYGMEQAQKLGCIPEWNEDMIRFVGDFWDQIPEIEFHVWSLWE